MVSGTQGENRNHLISDTKDLADLFRQKDYYCYQMEGSYSLKAVLPSLVPDLSYNAMAISDGNLAMYAYIRMCKDSDFADVERIKKKLLDYCGWIRWQ